jgi:hypothetical protein
VPGSRKTLEQWQMAELAALVAMLEYRHPQVEARVVYNVPLRSKISGTSRQFDTVVVVRFGDAEFRIVVEVEHQPHTKFDERAVEQKAAKARACGATHLTLVSAAGYTRGAQRLIAASDGFIDANLLTVAGDDDDRPSISFVLNVEGQDGAEVTLSAFRYRPLGVERERHIYLGTAVVGGKEVLVAVDTYLAPDNTRTMHAYCLPREETPYRFDRFQLQGWHDEDVQPSLDRTLPARQDPNPFIDPAKRTTLEFD